jgi:hypothetical protein
MENIKKVVRNEEWQRIRKSMQHTWNSEPVAKRNLIKLKKYLGKTKNENKLRRVHNYLGALRGVHYPGIASMRNEIKKKRVLLGYTN